MKTFLLYVIIILVVDFKAIGQNSEYDSVPVRISYLNAGQDNNKTRLNWKVVCYLSLANFEVQKSKNGVDYLTIRSFTADKIRCQSPFDFEDVVASTHTYYRLKVGDKDGNFSTSKIVETFGKEKSFAINSITPSLVTANTMVSISSSSADRANIVITNLQGILVKRLTVSLVRGVTDIRLNVSDLEKGGYIISVYNSNSERRTARLLKI